MRVDSPIEKPDSAQTSVCQNLIKYCGDSWQCKNCYVWNMGHTKHCSSCTQMETFAHASSKIMCNYSIFVFLSSDSDNTNFAICFFSLQAANVGQISEYLPTLWNHSNLAEEVRVDLPNIQNDEKKTSSRQWLRSIVSKLPGKIFDEILSI